jgi:hypothetical protein
MTDEYYLPDTMCQQQVEQQGDRLAWEQEQQRRDREGEDERLRDILLQMYHTSSGVSADDLRFVCRKCGLDPRSLT